MIQRSLKCASSLSEAHSPDGAAQREICICRNNTMVGINFLVYLSVGGLKREMLYKLQNTEQI